MLGKRLKEIRENMGISQADIASRIGASERQVLRWESNDADPSSENLKAIADYLFVSADYLLGNTDEPTPHIAPDGLSPMERKLFGAIRRGEIIEALETFTVISKTK